MTATSPQFDMQPEELVTRLFDLSDAGDFSNSEFVELDTTVYTRMAEHYGLEASSLIRTFG